MLLASLKEKVIKWRKAYEYEDSSSETVRMNQLLQTALMLRTLLPNSACSPASGPS